MPCPCPSHHLGPIHKWELLSHDWIPQLSNSTGRTGRMNIDILHPDNLNFVPRKIGFYINYAYQVNVHHFYYLIINYSAVASPRRGKDTEAHCLATVNHIHPSFWILRLQYTFKHVAGNQHKSLPAPHWLDLGLLGSLGQWRDSYWNTHEREYGVSMQEWPSTAHFSVYSMVVRAAKKEYFSAIILSAENLVGDRAVLGRVKLRTMQPMWLHWVSHLAEASHHPTSAGSLELLTPFFKMCSLPQRVM